MCLYMGAQAWGQEFVGPGFGEKWPASWPHQGPNRFWRPLDTLRPYSRTLCQYFKGLKILILDFITKCKLMSVGSEVHHDFFNNLNEVIFFVFKGTVKTTDGLFTCTFCGMHFNRRFNCNRHVNKVHANIYVQVGQSTLNLSP